MNAARRRLGAAARRESILSAAVPEFVATGYERTRVADIAARVGVTEPVIYQNFGTKAGLFVAVLNRAADEVVGHIAHLGAGSATVAEVLSALLAHGHQDRMHGGGGRGKMVAEAGTSSEPAIREAARLAHLRTLGAVSDLLRRGQKEESIRDDVEATAMAWLVLSQVHARQFRRAHSETSPRLERATVEALLNAMAPPPRVGEA